MGRLAVQVRLFEEVIEHKVIAVKKAVWLGDSPDAKVVFPGRPFQVRRQGEHLAVFGQRLMEGEEVVVEAGSFEVSIQHTPSPWHRWQSSLEIDSRFFAVTLVMVLAGGWIDAAETWAERQHWAGDGWSLTNTWHGLDGDIHTQGAPEAAVVRVQGDAGRADEPSTRPDGPQHLNDDRVTGIGYHRWFKRVVPADSNALQADLRLELDPDDVEARRIVGRAAYNSDRFALAAWHYTQIVERHPDDVHARLRLAWAERRQGHHRAEGSLYREILTLQPDHELALGGSSMAAARLGRFDEAQSILETLYVVAPTHPYTDLTSAVVESARGQDSQALRSLRRTIERRALLDEELQVELRRDIATDPTFSVLRSHWRLRAMLRRHFAAASPRGTR